MAWICGARMKEHEEKEEFIKRSRVSSTREKRERMSQNYDSELVIKISSM